MVWSSLIALLAPAAVDMLKDASSAVSRKVLGLSVDDEIKLKNADVERLKAIATLDNPYGTPSQWIVDLRASFRYIAAAFLIVAGISIMGVGVSEFMDAKSAVDEEGQNLAWMIILLGADTAGAPFSFIFGERMWTGLKGMRQK